MANLRIHLPTLSAQAGALATIVACSTVGQRGVSGDGRPDPTAVIEQVIDLEAIARVQVAKPTPAQLGSDFPISDTGGTLWGVGSSLVAIPAQGASPQTLPRCVFGTPWEGSGSIWFVTAEGLDPEPQTPGASAGAYTRYGQFLRLIPDLDGDEVSDLVVSAPGDFETPGKVFVVSTVTRKVLHVLHAPEANQKFGRALCPVPDQDGDAVPDLAIFVEEQVEGQPSSTRGSVCVFSTAKGTLLRTVLEESASGAYGVPQLEWLAPGEDGGAGQIVLGGRHPADRGVLLVMDLATGERTWSLEAATRQEGTAWSIAVTSDLDGDSVPELVVGDLGFGESRYSARVRILSGRTGSVLQSITGTESSTGSGMCLSIYPDLDGDARDEVVLPAAYDIFGGGALVLLSGRDGSGLRMLEFNGGFWRVGRVVSVGADWDGKGLADICVSSYVPTGYYDTCFAIGIVSTEDGTLLNYVSSTHLEQATRSNLER